MTQYFQLVLGYSPFSAALRMLPMAPIMIIVAPSTPWLSARLGANRAVGIGMLLIATGFLLFSQVGLHTGYWLIVAALIPLTSGMAMSMSPMTAAIMSAVPQRRAGAGSAMNDATRELGAALGVAVLGSIAASQYSSHLHDALGRLPAAARSAASSSIAGALHAAERLPGPAARDLHPGCAERLHRRHSRRRALRCRPRSRRRHPHHPLSATRARSRRRTELSARFNGEHRRTRSWRCSPCAR